MAAHLADRIRARLDAESRRALEHLDPTFADADPSRFLRLVDLFAVDVIKGMAIDAVQKANSGHPGGPCSSVDFAYVLFTRHLKASPNPAWADRDRFVLSGGHMSMLLYSLLYWQGRLDMKDLENFRQMGSRTQGHPVFGFAPGIESTTGPLGQGFANGVGMAIAEVYLRHLLGADLVDHHTYVLATDGDIQEGVCHEAASLAGHLKLGKLVVFYDANDIQLASPVAATMTEDVAMSFRAKGWHVLELPDGHCHRALDGAIAAAKDAHDRPSIIIGKTVIARGTQKAGSVSSHGSPLGKDVIADFKNKVAHPVDRVLWAPEAVRELFQERLAAGAALESEWKDRAVEARKGDPEMALLLDLLEGRPNEELGRRVTEVLKGLDLSKPASIATRSANGKVMTALKNALPHMIGGSADLSNSTKTDTFEKEVGMFPKDLVAGEAKGRGIAFGVREHAMGSIANGMGYHGGVLPFTGTFLAFADYMRPAVRLAAISHLPSLFIFTHDSVFLGEDGETHQPVEHVEALRLIPRLLVIRPGDAWETAASWDLIRAHTLGAKPRPVCLILSRQDLPVLEGAREQALQKIHQGAYILPGEGSGPIALQLVATGSEVHSAVAAATTLRARGVNVRVVSMPCQEIFREQPADVRHAILDPKITTVAIEAGVSKGWAAILGDRGHTIAIDTFGESAPYEALQEKYGFSEAAILKRLEALL